MSYIVDIYDPSDGDISHGSLVKTQLDGDGNEELEQLSVCMDNDTLRSEHRKCQNNMEKDEADEFEERVMRAIEMNIRRTLSEDDVAIDMYDDQTVYV